MTPTTRNYYLNQTCPEGSTLYYSLLKTPIEQREAIIFIYAFYNAIYHILFNCTDITIAQTKLKWWKEQVEKMYQQQSDHPITQALQPFIMLYKLPKNYFLEIIAGFETYLNTPIFPSQQEVYHHICHTAGARELLINHVLGNFNEETIRPTYQVTAGLELTQQIATLNYITAHGHCFFDEYALGENQLTRESFIALKTTDDIRALLKQKISLIKNYLEQVENLPKQLKIRAKIAEKLVSKIEKKYYQVLEKNIDILPLSKLWIALTNKKP
jgi:phytoene synthase